MKLIKYIHVLTIGVMLFTSCDVNQAPEFDDKDAFAAFTSTTIGVDENKGEVDIPVLLASLSGITTTVDFEIVADGSTAIEGKNYELLNTNKTLTFTKDESTQYIKLKLIDNNTFDGDVKLIIKLSNPKDVNLGYSKECNLTIADDEHPLLFILSTFEATGNSYYNGSQTWNITIEKDNDDLSKVWLSNLVVGGTSLKVYGLVNSEKTEIKIPVKQEIATSTTYKKVLLEGADGETGEDIPSGGFIRGTIAANGTITFIDEIYSAVYSDEAASVLVGYFNAFHSGIVLTKAK